MPAPTRWELFKEINKSRIGLAVKGLFALLVAGALGFWLLGKLHETGILQPVLAPNEHWSVVDCVYFAVITLTTVGYGETLVEGRSLHDFPDVRIYTAALLLLGMVATAYFLSSATAFFVEGDLKRVLERRRMLKTIESIGGHYIVCGAGQTGRHIAEELVACMKECVVIDADAKNVTALHENVRKVHSIVGDATRDDTLLDAGIERAAGLAAVLPDDKDNLFLTISARQLNPQLRIISKAVDMPTRNKLLKAGANGVVASNFIGGLRMASELMRPAVVNFLDQMLRGKQNVRFAEVRVGKPGAGRTLRELDAPRRVGLLVIALKGSGTEGFVYNPGPDVVVVDGTTMVVMGEVDRVARLEALVGDPRPAAATVVESPSAMVAPPATAEVPIVREPVRGEGLKDPRDNL